MRGKTYFLLGLLIVIALIIFNLPPTYVRAIRSGSNKSVSPYQHMFSRVFRGGDISTKIRNLLISAEEVETLEADLTKLKLENQRIPALERENSELRAVLGFKQRFSPRLVACEVIGRGDVTGWWQTIHLDKGSADGISTNQAVMAVDGLVGKTIEVYRESCDVLLITDPECKAGVRFGRIGSFGIVRGMGATLGGRQSLEMLCLPKPISVDYVPKEAPLMAGDEVITSGLGGVFPKDLLVGYVVKANLDESGLYQHADVRPAADLNALSYVFVVTD